VNRWKDWPEQARLNHAHAEHSLHMGDYAWACFAAQQAAEAALKALHQRLGQVAWGHSVVDLLDALPQSAQAGGELAEKTKALDKYYIPTRYPDAHPAGPAARYYTEADAREAVRLAGAVVDYCERKSLEV
jgi:HEPN domain-containing protein